MANILHIANGDHTAEILKNTTLEGDIIVWRELLCEGPTCNEVGSDEFWKKRYDFFENELNVARIEYFDKTIKEILKLTDVPKQTEIVLWFEFDLFCQVNLMALCSFILQNFKKEVTYSLVCTGYVKGKDRLQSLSDFLPSEYPELYKKRVTLSKVNLEFADSCWQAYVENDIEKLKEFNFKNRKFMYLQAAMHQHLKRFPTENGLNEIQQKIIEIIASEALTEKEIIQKLLIWQHTETVYGFGDLQYIEALKKLQEYYTIKDSKYSVTTKATKLLTIE
ncbi:DUF1835 domain-containing protein [Lutibacter holmesii]|uniref:DUF1835 domain-containing protein n=1 Tax=Lutibacter holmesii TaxID=1137985 RepID=A0ABW3WM19_9FLAO